jgi:hypothetical protein
MNIDNRNWYQRLDNDDMAQGFTFEQGFERMINIQPKNIKASINFDLDTATIEICPEDTSLKFEINILMDEENIPIALKFGDTIIKLDSLNEVARNNLKDSSLIYGTTPENLKKFI